MIAARGMLCLMFGEAAVSVAPATIHEDGGVFVVEETERNSAKTGDTVTYRRIGTIDPARLEKLAAQEEARLEHESEYGRK